MCDLVGVHQTHRVCSGCVVGLLLDSLLCLATVVSQISGRDELLPFIPFLFFHCVGQLLFQYPEYFRQKG